MHDRTEDEAPDTKGPVRPRGWRIAAGWTIVALNTVVTGLWAFWGAMESFHEGWYLPTLAANLWFMLLHLLPALIPLALGLFALRFPRLGAVVYIGIGLWLGGWFILTRDFGGDPVQIALSVAAGGFGGLLGVLWWFGRPYPKRWAYHVVWGVPLLVAIASGTWPAYRVATRFDDGDRGMRIVEGNGVRLTWAPAGPGWPRRGTTWHEAVDLCRHLTEDGLSLADEPQDIWRLPTVEEAVRSLTRHDENAGGEWDPHTGSPSYRISPDKETPLWDPTSPIVYWWTADEIDEQRAYRVVYNGGVWMVRKDRGPGTQAFRAVRDHRP
jgi:hypothetical protein